MKLSVSGRQKQKSRSRKFTALTFCALSFLASDLAVADQIYDPSKIAMTPLNQGWSVGVHWGQNIDNNVRTLSAFNPFAWDVKDYQLVSLGLRKKIFDYDKYFSGYAELNVSHIFKTENYNEIFFTPTVSWNYFPWDHVVDTTASIGVGLSYTSIESELDNSGKKLMASVIIELEMMLPEQRDWSVFGRIHHRSTAGIFAKQGGSNFPSIGLRYHLNGSN